MLKYTWLLLLLVIMITGCKKDNFDTESREIGREYFSYRVGSYLIYDVYQIVFDDFNNSTDTSVYELKEFIQSDFLDNQNRLSKRVERYTKQADSGRWILDDVWYETVTNIAAERIEENKRLIKLSFPLSTDIVWNGNKSNEDPEQIIYYSYIHEPYKGKNFSFDSTIMVVSDPIINKFEEQSLEEIYAKHIGLVSKKYVSILKNATGVKRGVKLYYTIKEYGY